MNYTVLVVEDEFDQRRAVIERVDWAAAGFEVIGEAENGVEALELLETLEPDLILTDIKMPMISGLELAERVREIRPVTQMVILSGYDSFEYARKAINYNIISYLLKPISSKELSEELFNIKKRMDEQLRRVTQNLDSDSERKLQRMQINNFLLPLMLGSNEEKPEEAELDATAIELGIIDTDSSPRFCVIVSKFKNSEGNPATDKKHADFIDAVLGKYMRSVSFLVYGRVVTLAIISGNGELSNILDLPLKETVQTAKECCRKAVLSE